VQCKQRFYRFEVPDEADDSGAGAWAMDNEGRLYAATRMGVQAFDRNGRVRAILPVPGGEVTGLAFGGASFDVLYVSCADHRIYRRKLGVPGAPSWAAPIQLPAWSAG
jgi:sugar lactone lactonase YvrE